MFDHILIYQGPEVNGHPETLSEVINRHPLLGALVHICFDDACVLVLLRGRDRASHERGLIWGTRIR